MHSVVMKRLRKRSGFVIYSNYKDSAFSAVKRDANFYTRLSIEGIRKGYTFSFKKWCIKG